MAYLLALELRPLASLRAHKAADGGLLVEHLSVYVATAAWCVLITVPSEMVVVTAY